MEPIAGAKRDYFKNNVTEGEETSLEENIVLPYTLQGFQLGSIFPKCVHGWADSRAILTHQGRCLIFGWPSIERQGWPVLAPRAKSEKLCHSSSGLEKGLCGESVDGGCVGRAAFAVCRWSCVLST